MCSRFGFVSDPVRIKKRFEIDKWFDDLDKYKPRYNIAPNTEAMIITRGSVEAHKARFGLIPKWSKEPRMKFSTINARAETADSLPTYRESFKNYRCLVPFSHYYEWRHDGEKKIPYLFKLANRDIGSFAGLYSIWKDATGRETWTFSIITVDANSLGEKIHPRMPVILDQTTEETWLDPETKAVDLMALLKPYESNYMETYLVDSRVVNKPGNDTPAAVEKL